MPQIKTGYIRGVKGVLITPIQVDGSVKAGATSHWIKTASEVNYEANVVEGEKSTLRGGDTVLCQVEDPDIVVGVNLTLKKGNMDLPALQIIGGGTLITTGVDPDIEVTGWKAPTVAEQANKEPFRVELYATNFTSGGTPNGYVKVTIPYCNGRMPDGTFADKEWYTPEFSIKGTENGATAEPCMAKEFIATLPAEASA